MTRMLIAAVPVALMLMAPAPANADAAKGQEVYAKRCKGCHAEDGAGNAMLKKKNTPALTSAAVQGKAAPALKKSLMEGATHKTPAKGMADADVDNVLAYVKSMKK